LARTVVVRSSRDVIGRMPEVDYRSDAAATTRKITVFELAVAMPAARSSSTLSELEPSQIVRVMNPPWPSVLIANPNFDLVVHRESLVVPACGVTETFQ